MARSGGVMGGIIAAQGNRLVGDMNCDGVANFSDLIAPSHAKTLLNTKSPGSMQHCILHENHFPAGKRRESVRTTAGHTTTPDWLHADSKTAVYLDGKSRNLHGDPRTAQRDQLIRQMLELDGYTVIVIQSRDLDDPEAVGWHLRKCLDRNRRKQRRGLRMWGGIVGTNTPWQTASRDGHSVI